MIKNLRDRVLLANPVALVVMAAVSVTALTIAYAAADFFARLPGALADAIRAHAFELVQLSVAGMVIGFLMIAIALPHLIRGQR